MDLLAQFAEKFVVRLDELGFAFQRRHLEGLNFWTPPAKRRLFFALGVGTFSREYQLRSWTGVRFEEIESVFHQTSGFFEDGPQETDTVGTKILDLARMQKAALKANCIILRPNTLDEAIALALDEFKHFAIPFYERFTTLETIDTELNGHPEKLISDFCRDIWIRASKGLIVAKLLGRGDYDELRMIYTSHVSKDAKFFLKRFERLLDLLAAYPSSFSTG